MIPWIQRLSIRLGINTHRSDSQNQSQKAKASRGGTVTQTNNFFNDNAHKSAPDMFVQIYGNGSTRQFRTHFDNKSGKMLTIDSIKVNGEVTDLNQAVSSRGGFSTDGMNFPAALFTQSVDQIEVSVQYHTLDDTDRNYQYTIHGKQIARTAGGYNVEFLDPPNIRQIT